MGKVRQLLISSADLSRLASTGSLGGRRLFELALTYAYANRIDKQSLYSILRLTDVDMARPVVRLREVNEEVVDTPDEVRVDEPDEEVIEVYEHRVEDRYLGQRVIERLIPHD